MRLIRQLLPPGLGSLVLSKMQEPELWACNPDSTLDSCDELS